MSRIDAPERRDFISSISSRICAWIVTSSAVVGSSAIEERGVEGRAQSRSSRAAAGRRRSDADTASSAARRRGCDLREDLDGAAMRVSLLTRSCAWITSITCMPIVNTGFSDVIGSWKHHADVVAADPADLFPRELQQVAAAIENFAGDDLSGGSGIRRGC